MTDMETTHETDETAEPEFDPAAGQQPAPTPEPAGDRTHSSAVVAYGDRDREIIASVVGQGQLTNDEIDFVMAQATRLGLDVMTKHMHAWKQDGKLIMMVGIDGLRLVARRTGKFRGRDDPEWLTADGRWVDAFIAGAEGHGDYPLAARVRVHHVDDLQPTTGIALWAECAKLKYDQQAKKRVPTRQWAQMPAHMLAKVAEAMALRAAFPAELAGVYTDDEISRADEMIRDVGDPTSNPGAGDSRIAALEARLAGLEPETRAKLEHWWATNYAPGVLKDPGALPLCDGGLHRFTGDSEHVTFVAEMIGRAETHDATQRAGSTAENVDTAPAAAPATDTSPEPSEPATGPEPVDETAPFTDLEAGVLVALEDLGPATIAQIAEHMGARNDAALKTAVAALNESDIIAPHGDGRGPLKQYARNEEMIADIEGNTDEQQ